ncbi:MAG: peptidase M28, partial [archaeon]
MKKKLKTLKKLTEAKGAPGSEEQVKNIMIEELKDICLFENDGLGSLIAYNTPKFKEKPTVMIASHMDEIGLIVNKIDSKGYIKFYPLGGWWGHVLLGQEMIITTSTGKEILGIIGSTPPHLLEGNARNTVVRPDKMFIDIG